MADKDFQIPKSLIKALTAHEVVPFVGAGVSMTVKKKNADGTESDESLFPSWKGFVKILAEALRDEHKPEEADFVLSSINIKKPKYLDALQHAHQELGESHWYKLFEECFDISATEAHSDSLKLNKLIWKLSNNLIITTNVDRVFQWTCPQPSEFRNLDVQKVEYAQLQKEQIPKRPTVWYLHGHIDHKEKVIFTREQFESFYKQKDNEAKLQTLLSFLTQRTFLFIGFSLDDDYLRELLEYIHNLYKSGADSFYILFRERDIPTANFPTYVTPIPFSEFGKPLEDLVEELIRIAKGDDDDADDDVNDGKPDPPPISDPDAKKPFFNVPYNSKGAEFVGRVGKIGEIWDSLNKSGCAAIGQAVSVKGFGGLGKTQLAVEYAHAYRDKYQNGVFWLVADTTVDNQIVQIAAALGWINDYDKSVNQIEVAKTKFLGLSDCLILVDNVESFDDVKEYLPKTDSRTHLLITSREKDGRFKEIDIDLLKPDESRELLLKISKRNPADDVEKAELEKVLAILDGIPLAIELVGGFLAEHENITFAKYHNYLDEYPLDTLEKEFPKGSFTGHDISIIRTLRISEKTVSEKPLMVEILKVLAWSGSSSMGTSLLKALVEAENDFEFDTALGDAYKLRLLKKDEDAERYAIHRLLAKVIRHEKPLEEQNEWHQKIVRNLEKWNEPKIGEYSNLSEFEAELEHLREWQQQTAKHLPVESILITAFRANHSHERGNYQKANQWIEQAFNVYQENNLNDPKLLGNLFNYLGVNYNFLGNAQKAQNFHQKALEIRRELFGENHPDTANSYNNVGSTYGDLGKHQEALQYEEKALELQKELFGEKHPNTATYYNNIGLTYGELGDHKKALEYKEKALKLHQELLGKQHPNTISTVRNLIITYQELDNKEKAGRKAAEYFSFVPQNHFHWKWFEEISRLYRSQKNRHKKNRRR